jgi:hypothetical protein
MVQEFEGVVLRNVKKVGLRKVYVSVPCYKSLD